MHLLYNMISYFPGNSLALYFGACICLISQSYVGCPNSQSEHIAKVGWCMQVADIMATMLGDLNFTPAQASPLLVKSIGSFK